MGLFTNVSTRLSKSGRNLRKKEFDQAKRQARHQIDSIMGEQAFRAGEDVREQVGLKQGMFARGLGKSTIHDQDKGRLDLIHKNRNEALERSLQIAHKNLSLIKKRWRYSKRIQWAQSVDDLLSLVGGAATIYGGATGNATMGAVGQGMQGAGGAAPNY